MSCGGGAYNATLYNCTVTNNSSQGNGGGVLGTLYNCLVTSNEAAGTAGGAESSTLYNCTVTGNKANYGGGVRGSTLYNSIVYFNDATTSGSNWTSTGGANSFTNSCTTPTNDVWAIGNITNDPMFLVNGSGYGTNHVAGNYRLAPRSPCINTGTNFSWMTDSADLRSKDLDWKPRIRYETVDMGCYEHMYKGTTFIVQ